jgi:diguanylate cyclase (GGDEF)-like protein
MQKFINKLNYYSIKAVFAWIGFLLMFVNFLFITIFEYYDHKKVIIYTKQQEIHRLLNQISDVVEYNLNNNQENNLDSYLSNLSTDSNLQLIIITDEKQKILHSTRRKWLEDFAPAVLESYLGTSLNVNKYGESLSSILVELNESNNILFGIVPIFYLKENLSIRDLHKGNIYLIYDLNKLFKEEFSTLLFKVFFSLVRAFVVLFILLVLFDVLVSRRITLLLETIEKTKNGNISHNFRIAGKDEISKISNAFQDMTERLQKILYYEPVTGTFNRFAFELKAKDFLRYANEHRAFIILDIDNFKEINDIYGHKIGDLCLREFANHLILTFKDGIVGRLGGDEFIIFTKAFFSDNELKDYLNLSYERLHTPFILGENIFELKTTMGVSIFPSNGLDYKVLYKNSDIALFHGKQSGKNRFTIIDDKILKKIERRNFIIQQIKSPNFYHELMVYYQPVVSIKTKKIECLEALLRWNSPYLGMVSPMELIPILEETGQVKELGRWVLETVTKQIREWEKAGYSIAVNVNVSFQEFSQKDYPGFVQKTISDSGIKPNRIKLEITESEIMRNLDQTLKNLLEIRSLGLELAIDDFGTGYSSLSYLKNLPVTHLKIDKSFISDIPQDQNDAVLVSTILKLSHTFGFIVVAEGVETKEQWSFLEENGCDEIQGFFISPPVPVQEIQKLMSK